MNEPVTWRRSDTSMTVRARESQDCGVRPGAGRAEPLLDATQVAELLGVPKSWVYAEARAGRIPHVPIGRYRRFKPRVIEEWVEARERGPVQR